MADIPRLIALKILNREPGDTFELTAGERIILEATGPPNSPTYRLILENPFRFFQPVTVLIVKNYKLQFFYPRIEDEVRIKVTVRIRGQTPVVFDSSSDRVIQDSAHLAGAYPSDFAGIEEGPAIRFTIRLDIPIQFVKDGSVDFSDDISSRALPSGGSDTTPDELVRALAEFEIEHDTVLLDDREIWFSEFQDGPYIERFVDFGTENGIVTSLESFTVIYNYRQGSDLFLRYEFDGQPITGSLEIELDRYLLQRGHQVYRLNYADILLRIWNALLASTVPGVMMRVEENDELSSSLVFRKVDIRVGTPRPLLDWKVDFEQGTTMWLTIDLWDPGTPLEGLAARKVLQSLDDPSKLAEFLYPVLDTDMGYMIPDIVRTIVVREAGRRGILLQPRFLGRNILSFSYSGQQYEVDLPPGTDNVMVLEMVVGDQEITVEIDRKNETVREL